MGKASSAKKVARAARAGGNRRAGQRRALGFPVAIGLVIVVGLLLVVFAREKRNADAFPRANKDHVHSAIDIYTCVVDTSATSGSTTTTSTSTSTTVAPGSAASDATTTTVAADATTTTESTTSTTAPTSTTQANPNDVHGEYQPAPQDAKADDLGIHSHGDGLIHIHPFTDSAAGRKATLGVFLDQVGISMTNDTLILPSGTTFTEGTTKCEGGKDGIVQVAKWDHVADAAKGNKPNQIFTDGFDKIRLGADESFTIAFMPKDSTIPAKPDVANRVAQVSDLGGSTTTTAPSSSEGSAPPPTDTSTSTSSDAGSTTTTASSSSGP
jgi:hypothetical protein